MRPTYARHHEETLRVPAGADVVFSFVDDHENLSSHMGRQSVMTAGGRFWTRIDDGHAQNVGSHIRMGGRVLGIALGLDEVVTLRDAPAHKAWETVEPPDLLVVGPYRMALDITPRGRGASDLRVSIDYDLPAKNSWLGRLFGGAYARWCVRQMTDEVKRHFAHAP